jgi:ribosomal protein L40E
MPFEPESPSQAPDETNEKQLCVSCVFPNEPTANFCVKCGAPLTSYASTGPFEHLFAEGHAYRQAAERPRSLIVVLGVWLIFGMTGIAGVVLVQIGLATGIMFLLIGGFLLMISLAMIWKTTRNYMTRAKTLEHVRD